MLKKTIKFTDFNDEEREEIAYFNITRSELVDLASDEGEGKESLMSKLKRIGNKEATGKEIMDTFRYIISISYGKKSPDGLRFIKSGEISHRFEQTAAYDALFVDLCTNASSAAEFVSGILPKGMPEFTNDLTGETK